MNVKLQKRKLSEKRIAEMWCELNRWDVPKELIGFGLASGLRNKRNEPENVRITIMGVLELFMGGEILQKTWMKKK